MSKIDLLRVISEYLSISEITTLMDDLIRENKEEDDIKELIMEWIPILEDVDRLKFQIEVIETKGHAITGRIDCKCDRCGKYNSRFNGEDIICLNCGYKPYVKKTKLLEDLKALYNPDTGVFIGLMDWIHKLEGEMS